MTFSNVMRLIVLGAMGACATANSLLEPDTRPAKIEYYGVGGIAALKFAHHIDSATGVVTAGAPELCEQLQEECAFPAVVIRTMTRAEVDALFQAAASRDFAALDREYVPSNTCCDRRDHHILVRANGFRRTVRWFDGVDMPQVLVSVAQQVFVAGTQRN
ncbi:MAG TPA: hypothetical protein VJ717_09960 [Gemmatimonadaceae bacterium]|nr:hypothetical protein [Gemmatimonadaceae bacterium]